MLWATGRGAVAMQLRFGRCHVTGTNWSQVAADKRLSREAMPDRERLPASGREELVRDVNSEQQRQIISQVSALGKKGQWEDALQLFAGVEVPSPVLGAATVDACARSLQVDLADQLLLAMPIKSTWAFNSVILALGRKRRIEQAEKRFQEMLQLGLRPNAASYGCLITAFGTARDSQGALRTFEQMEAAGMAGTAISFATLLAACGKAGDIQLATEVLVRMKAAGVPAGVKHLTSAITSCARSKDLARAEEFLAMIRQQCLQPDSVAYTALLACLSPPGAAQKSYEVVADMRRDGVVLDIFTYNRLLQLALAEGDVDHGKTLIGEIDSLGLRHNYETSVRVKELNSLIQDSVMPDGWQATLDPSTGQNYYWHASDPSGSVTWKRPQQPVID